MVLGRLLGNTIDVAGRAFSAPQQRRSPAHNNELNAVIRERLEDRALVGLSIFVVTHEVSRPSSLNWATNAARSAAVRIS